MGDTKNLWLFDYDDGLVYERFSQCEDYTGQIAAYLKNNYDFCGKSILEIGAGSGKFTGFLADSCNSLYVVERSKSLMNINQTKNFARHIEYELNDVKNAKLPPKHFDFVFGGWSMTSMRDSFAEIFDVLKGALKDDGKIVLVENAGNDEFASITGIDELSAKMRSFYKSVGFVEKAILDTVIDLPNKDVFYDAFPNQRGVELRSTIIRHRVLILEASADSLKGGDYYENS